MHLFRFHHHQCFQTYIELLQLGRGCRAPRVLALPGLAVCGALLALWYVRALLQGDMPIPLSPSADLSLQVLEGRVDYLERWLFYIDGISSSWTNALLGHAKSPVRQLYPSALNYYLDFAYNFGLLGLLPLVLLALYSVLAVVSRWSEFWASGPTLGLALVVIFLLTFDSSGLRQPYPGVIIFFLWGLLLAVISRPRCTIAAFNERGG